MSGDSAGRNRARGEPATGSIVPSLEHRSRATAPIYVPKYDSKLEKEFAYQFEAMRRADQIAAWWHKPIRLRLATGAWYTPDFMVQHNDEELVLHEIKGHWREAAKVRTKVIRDLYPFRIFVNNEEWRP